MVEHEAVHDKDAILRDALTKLRGRLSDPAWRDADRPYQALRAECLVLGSDEVFREELRTYVRERTILKRAIESFFTHISMAARARWQDAPPDVRGVVARGWFLGRWLPTFLVIDGPIGRFFLNEASPLGRRASSGLYPVISSACSLIREKSFRTLRNGFAHWGFAWEVVDRDSFIVAYDWERDMPTVRLHREEADAFHMCAYAFIEVVNDVLISERAFVRPEL